jgi:hypothetical protein
MSENAISAQGTLLRRQTSGAGAFAVIGELGDLTPPELSRNPIEVTTHDSDDNHYVVGIRRTGELQVNIFFRPGLATHNSLTGLIQGWDEGTRDIWEIEYPDGSTMMFSGFVINVGPDAPVDDALSASVAIRPTNRITFDDVVV